MRLEHFQYIVEIARCKSMSKASKKLFITQPSLSTAIQSLETELGFQIFKRSASGVALTEKGESLLHIAEEIVFQLEQIKELSDIENTTIVNINLAAVPVFCNALMIDLIQKFKQDSPFINLNITELRPCKILPSLISSDADLGIGTYSPSTKEQIFQEASKNNLHIEPIFEDRMVCFLPRNHPLAQSKSVSYAQLKEYKTPVAVYNDYAKMDTYDCIDTTETLKNRVQNNSYTFTDRSSIKKAVAKGMAVATLPRLMTYDDIYVTSGMIIPKPIVDTDVRLTTYIAYSSRQNNSHAASLTLNAIRTLYEKMNVLFAEQERIAKVEEKSANLNRFMIY